MSNLVQLAYSRINLKDNTLDEKDLSTRCPLDNGKVTRPAQFDLGILDRLPTELLHAILTGLDMRTLTDFRRVNLRALAVLDGVPEYRTIITHAPDLLRGVLSIQTAQWVTCKKLFSTLCNAQCEACGDFGGYIYILTCNRVCFLCFTESPAYLPISFRKASKDFGIAFKDLKDIHT